MEHEPSGNVSEQVVTVEASRQSTWGHMDEILDKEGPYGLMQVIVHVSMFYIHLGAACHSVLSSFTGNNPSWRCTNNNNSLFCAQNYNRTISSDSDMFNERCYLNRTDWTFTTSRNYSFVTEFDLVCDKTSIAAFISASYYFGCVLGALAIGPIGDGYGRKLVIVMSALIVPFPTILSSYVNAIWQLYILNIIRGIGSTGCIYAGYVYLSEICPPMYRSTSLNIYILMACFSYLIADLFAYYVRTWRQLSMYVGLLEIPFWIACYFLPESPRWLIAKGKKDEAEIILGKIIHFKGKRKASMHVEATHHETIRRYTYIDLVRNIKILKFTLTIVLIWTVLPVLYYSIAMQSTTLGGNMYEDYALCTVADIPAFFFASFLNNRIGRKKTNLGGCLSSGLLLGSILLIPRSISNRHTIIMAITVVARFSCSVSFYGIFVWTSELFPTVVRSQGLSICATFEKIGMIFVPFVTRLLQGVNYNLPFILMCTIGVLASIAGVWLPETNKQPTRENYEDFFPKPSNDTDTIGFDNAASVRDEHV